MSNYALSPLSTLFNCIFDCILSYYIFVSNTLGKVVNIVECEIR